MNPLFLALVVFSAPDPPVVDLNTVTFAEASDRHGQLVRVRLITGKPSFTWNAKTVAGAADRDDEIERVLVVAGERVIDAGESIELTGRLWVIHHPPDTIGGQVVAAWIEIRVEEE